MAGGVQDKSQKLRSGTDEEPSPALYRRAAFLKSSPGGPAK